MNRQTLDDQRSQAFGEMIEGASERMLFKIGEIYAAQRERLDVEEGGEVACDICETPRDDPVEILHFMFLFVSYLLRSLIHTGFCLSYRTLSVHF